MGDGKGQRAEVRPWNPVLRISEDQRFKQPAVGKPLIDADEDRADGGDLTAKNAENAEVAANRCSSIFDANERETPGTRRQNPNNFKGPIFQMTETKIVLNIPSAGDWNLYVICNL